MPQEPGFFRSGEVDFKLRPNRDQAAFYQQEDDRKRRMRAWQNRHSEPVPIVGWLLLAAIVAIALSLASCSKRDDLIAVKTSDGQTLMLTREQIQTMAVSGGDVPWDFTKLKDPPEPQTPLGPNPPPRTDNK
jgi:hypothetical protein